MSRSWLFASNIRKPSGKARHQARLHVLFREGLHRSTPADPQINAEVSRHDIVYRNYYDIGIAVGGGKGLVVPVLRNATE